MPAKISVQTQGLDDWCDITAQVREHVTSSGLRQGTVSLFVPHTTAGICIQENADPPLRTDIVRALQRLFPREGNYGHCEDNAASHMKAVLTGSSVQIPVQEGALLLGTWQGIYLCEFDGPRQRDVVITLTQEFTA